MHPECSNKENPLSTNNLIFLGCKIVRGKGKGIVISTGIDTLIQDLGYKCNIIINIFYILIFHYKGLL